MGCFYYYEEKRVNTEKLHLLETCKYITYIVLVLLLFYYVSDAAKIYLCKLCKFILGYRYSVFSMLNIYLIQRYA